MKPVSIRMRLTLWYSSILGVTFALLGGGLFYEIREGLYNELDQGLLTRFERLEPFLKSMPRSRWAAELNEGAEEPSGSAGDVIEIRQQHGEFVYQSSTSRGLWAPMTGVTEGPQFARGTAAGRSFRILTTRVNVDDEVYSVLLGADARQADAAIARVGWLLVSAIPLALALASGGGYWMARRALRPVDAITESARAIGASNLSRRLQEPGTGDELQRLSETLNEMIGRLEASFRGMTQFTADASHELRTPVTLIRTAAELSLRNPQTELEYRETLMDILEEAERTSLLIEGLMILARGDSGSETIIRDPVDLSSTIAAVIRQGKALAQMKQIDVSGEIPEIPISVFGDAQRLNRLFLILMDNAVKYTLPGGIVQVRVDVKEGCPVVVVRDSGIGISGDDMPHIFERFYRADKARSREQDGFGLGLAIAKYIADVHGATISVDSTADLGSTFVVTFPRS